MTSLSRFAPSPQGDAANTAGRPLHGGPDLGCPSFMGCGWRTAPWITSMTHLLLC